MTERDRLAADLRTDWDCCTACDEIRDETEHIADRLIERGWTLGTSAPDKSTVPFRDRLAVLLRSAIHDPGSEYDYADRLIAAGVGFVAAAHRPYSWACPECGTTVTTLVRSPLDVDRLARALRTIPVPTSYEEWLARGDASYEDDAAAIAAEYERLGADR